MPFTQRENISQFLRACEMPPLNLPAHDRFLTVDLYDHKDPAQVVQCLGAFSRAANAVNPSKFPRVIGPKRAGAKSPTRRNNSALSESVGGYGRDRGVSNASQGSDSAFSARQTAERTMSPTLTGGSTSSRATDGSLRYSASNVSSWSKKGDETSTAPAWNIHQYGYMGGASQGNQSVSFGARRQIVSQAPQVPSMVEKEKRRKEQEAEAEKIRIQDEGTEHKRRMDREAEEERNREEEERKWEEDSRKAKEVARQELEEQKRRWAEEERQWQEAEEQRQREEKANEEAKKGSYSALGLRNPLLDSTAKDTPRRVSESERIRELERQLEEAKERERQYQLERQARVGQQQPQETPQNVEQTRQPDLPARKANPASDDERNFLREQWESNQDTSPVVAAQPSIKRPLPVPRKPSGTVTASLTKTSETPKPVEIAPVTLQTPSVAPPTPLLTEPLGPRPPPGTTPSHGSFSTTPRPPRFPGPSITPSFSRFIPTPSTPSPATAPERFIASTSATPPPAPRFAPELSMSSTSERAAEDARRVATQARTKAGGLANKSLLEREMERERERQKEWEEAQMAKTGGGGRGLMGPREMKR